MTPAFSLRGKEVVMDCPGVTSLNVTEKSGNSKKTQAPIENNFTW